VRRLRFLPQKVQVCLVRRGATCARNPCIEDAIETNRPIAGIAKAAPARHSYDRIMNDAR
jgi:hypothetical protein